jgi:hypothetical protein
MKQKENSYSRRTKQAKGNAIRPNTSGSISPTYILMKSSRSSQKLKNSFKLSLSFYAFGIFMLKSCSLNVDEIDT